MQPRLLCLLWEVGSDGVIVIPCSLRRGDGCLFVVEFSFVWTRYERYLMAFLFIHFMKFLMLDFGMFRLASFLMECSCIVPLTPIVMVMRGLVFHSLLCMMLISGSYLVCLCVRA